MKGKRVMGLRGSGCFFLVLAMTLLVVLLIHKEAPTQTAYNIGCNLAYTGPGASYTEMYKEGYDLAIKEINAKGGIDGVKLLAIEEDNQMKPEMAVSVCEKFVSVDKTHFDFCMGTPSCLAVAPLATKHKHIVLNCNCIGPELLGCSPYMFHIPPNGIFEAAAMANYMYRELGYRKVATFNTTDAYGVAMIKGFERFWKELGGVIVGAETYPGYGTMSFISQWQKLKVMNADAVLLAGAGGDQGRICKQWGEVGVKTPICTFSGFEVPEVLTMGRGHSEGIIYTSRLYPIETSEYREFLKAYKAQYGKTEPNSYTAMHYDGIYAFAKAVKYAKDKGWGSSGEALRNAFLKLDFEGSSGAVRFNPEDGTCTRPLAIKTIRDGKFQMLGGYDLAKKKLVPIK